MGFKTQYTLAAVYDTETTNMYEGVQSRAFPCLFIVNDIRGVDVADYTPERDDNIKLMRYEQEMQDYINGLVSWGLDAQRVPIIAAYNLMFDLQPLMEDMRKNYDMEVCAQSSTHVYTLDLLNEDGKTVLRFWDTFYLEMRGLEAMGETCGLEKAKGDWDYTKIRTPETYLTKDEIHYAKRDVQVIPAYLKYLLKANEWLKQGDLGVSVLTKTSLVRQMAKREIGNKKMLKDSGKEITQMMMFSKLCDQELPKTFESYGLRRACFRGGLTFTSAKYAMQVVENVASLDVTSMHHAFINGRYIPVKFKKANKEYLEQAYDYIVNETELEDVLYDYHRPFQYAFHMLIRLDNIRLKKGTCFDEWGIATIPSAKFRAKDSRWTQEEINNYANIYAEEMNRMNGWVDRAKGAKFAFGKLYEADVVFMHVTEVELWALSMVYEWDSHECILGEATQNFNRPPDYVTLQSNLLYGMKNDVKGILKKYHQHRPYQEQISSTIPDGLANQIKRGIISEQFLESYYSSTVKGQFNSIYGTMAQDVYKPDYLVLKDGTLEIDKSTQISKKNWNMKQPEWCRVLYTYGMRIVGGSRLHLIIAMKLLYDRFGDSIKVTGGDTDSLKIACNNGITDEDLLEALEPLHKATKNAIDLTQERAREEYPNICSSLDGIGCFEVEKCGSTTRYATHMEAWNKARVSIDSEGKVHVTCAGLSRPEGEYTIVNFIEDILEDTTPEELLPLVLGFNTWVQPKLSHSLETHHPATTDMFDNCVKDYRGHKAGVFAHESNALYESNRLLGDITKNVNRTSIDYLMERYGRSLDVREKILDLDSDGNPVIYIDGELALKGARKNGN